MNPKAPVISQHNRGKTEACSDVCECHIYDFPREAYSPVVDVDQKVYF